MIVKSMKKHVMRIIIKGLLATVGIMLFISPFASSAIAVTDSEPSNLTLSTHWHYKILRWESLIIQAANHRQLDPDFLASLVWMESRGDPYAVGPVGAVGLMQVMPREAGFTWRPSQDILVDPEINLFWGSRTLATVISQGQGDVFNALAAYNGGWDQIMYRGPTIFATTILRDYAHAVAQRYAVAGPWIAFFARKDIQIKGPIWIADSERSDVYYYGRDNIVPDGVPLIPDVAPSSVVAYSQDEKTGGSYIVGVWIYVVNNGEWLVTPSPEGSLFLLDKESSAEAATQTGDDAPRVEKPNVVSVVPKAPAAVETSTPEFVCLGGDFWVDAWPLESVVNLPGWRVRIFAEGHGGDCQYTYAWNVEEDIKGEVTGGPITFEIDTPRRDAAIVGTVVVSSAGETIRVPLYVHPPKK